jgi:hypothetical protein
MSFFISYPLSTLVHISSLEPISSQADKGYDMKNAMSNNKKYNVKMKTKR